MQKGGVIMDVTTPEQARIAEAAGAVAVMALQAVPADICKNAAPTCGNFVAGGIATPADAAFMMRLGADGVFVGSGIFKAENPEKMAKAIVEAVNDYDNPVKLAEISKGIGSGLKGICADMIPIEEALLDCGW